MWPQVVREWAAPWHLPKSPLPTHPRSALARRKSLQQSWITTGGGRTLPIIKGGLRGWPPEVRGRSRSATGPGGHWSRGPSMRRGLGATYRGDQGSFCSKPPK